MNQFFYFVCIGSTKTITIYKAATKMEMVQPENRAVVASFNWEGEDELKLFVKSLQAEVGDTSVVVTTERGLLQQTNGFWKDPQEPEDVHV